MEILYCDRCGIRVPEKDLEEGRAVRSESSIVCAQCNKIKTVKPVGASKSSGAHLLPGTSKSEKRSEVAVKPAQKAPLPAAAVGSHRVASGSRSDAPKNTQTTILLILGLLVLAVGVLLALRSGEKPTASAPPKLEAPPPSSSGSAAKPQVPTPVPSATKTAADPADRPSTPPPPETELTPEEKEAQSAYEALLRFEGLAADDKAGRLQRIDAFVAKYGGTLEAARARVLADDFRSPKTPVSTPPIAISEPPLLPDPTAQYGAAPPFALDGCHFIWFPEDTPQVETRYFRRSFELPAGARIKSASMLLMCDDYFTLFVNGRRVASSKTEPPDWTHCQWVDLTEALRPGKNLLAVTASNLTGPAMILGRLRMELSGGTAQALDIDKDWKASDREQEGWTLETFDDKAWVATREVGTFGTDWKDAKFPDKFTFVVAASPYANFIKFDKTTKGNWKGAYGSSGYSLSAFNGVNEGRVADHVHDVEKLPEYLAELKKEGSNSYVWRVDPVNSLVSPDGTRRASTCDYGDNVFAYLIKLKETRFFRLALYFLDFAHGRKLRIEILDADKGTVLDTREVENFTEGIYPSWTIHAAAIRVRITRLGEYNAQCCALFFDPLPGEAAADTGGAKTSASEPGDTKTTEPKAASSDAVLAEAELYLRSSRWKEALEKIECLISNPPEGKFTEEQKIKADTLRTKARNEMASIYLRSDRVKLAGAKRQLPDGRWEFLYDFRNVAQKMDFLAPPNKLDSLDKGELMICNVDAVHLLEFADDLEVSYEVATATGPANRLHLGYYDVRGEFGGDENKWTAVWRDIPNGWLTPLSKNDSLTLVPGKWHRVEILFEKKTKSTTINIDGKQGLKFSDPAGAGKGIVYLGCAFGAKFRNLGIRGMPTLESLDRAEQIQKFALDCSRKFAAGQAFPILTKNDEPFWIGGIWKLTGEEAGGLGALWIPGLASPNYELNFECRRTEGKEFQVYFRADAIHSWSITFFDGGMHARIWDHGQNQLAKGVKALACDSTAWHKIQVLSRGKTLRVVMDEKEVLFDLKDVPLDAWGPYFNSWDSKCSVRKATIRYVP